MPILTFDDWRTVESRDKSVWPWPNFTPQELACKCGMCGGTIKVETRALDLLQAARFIYDAPIHIASAYRCPEHPIESAKPGGPGPHSTGAAFDAYPSGDLREFLRVMHALPWGGVGMGNKDGKLHLHFDTLETRAWGY